MSTPRHQPSMLTINEESPGQGGKVQEPEQGREEESVQGTRGGSLLSEEEQKEKRQKEKRQRKKVKRYGLHGGLLVYYGFANSWHCSLTI